MIPKIAHFIWLGPPLPDYLGECVESFRLRHPSWSIWWWDEDSLSRAVTTNTRMFKQPDRWVNDHSVYQLQSDVARLELLNAFGGVYVDCDFLWNKPVDPHLAGSTAVTVWERQGSHVANGFIASTPGHGVIKDAILRTSRVEPSGAEQANRVTGPSGVWTDTVLANLSRITVLEQKLMLNTPWDQPEGADQFCPGAIASHLWHHQRTIRGIA